MNSEPKNESSKVFRAGWPQWFALGHLLFLATMTLVVVASVDTWRKVGLSVFVMCVDFAAAPILLLSAGRYQSYEAIIAVIVVGTFQWAAIGWCVGWTVRKLSRVSNTTTTAEGPSKTGRFL
jgi:hypothetical protein